MIEFFIIPFIKRWYLDLHSKAAFPNKDKKLN